MIVLCFTGGTISMRHDPVAGGAVPALAGRDIVALVQGIERVTDFEVDDFGAFPGPHLTVERLWTLRNRLAAHLARPEVDGIVVTHGTDSLEETAYLMTRSLPPEKPIAITGAMRTSSDLGWDGPANLDAAVRTAASDESRGQGTLVVMNDRIYSGLDVTKTHTHSLDAFESPGLGPLGVVDDGQVIYRRALPERQPVLSPTTPATPVDIVYAYTGAEARLLDAARRDGVGVVVAAMGRGNVPPAMAEGVWRWLDEKKPVVITSRALRGRVGRTYGYPGAARRLAERGAILGGSRRPQQARIDLMLALGSGMRGQQLRDLFEG